MKNSVTIRLYAAARSAASKSEVFVAPGRLDAILDAISLDNARLKQVLEQCSFLLDGVVVHDKKAVIPANATLDILPPFAGG